MIRDDVGEQLLNNLGITDKIQEVADNKSNIMKLQSGRIDLWAYEENVAKWQYKSAGNDPSELAVYYTLKEGEVYYALNINTSDTIVNTLQKALDEIRESGDYQKIINKYLK